MHRLMLLCLWFAAAAGVANAQPPPATPPVTSFRAGVELVTLTVSVTDGDDRHVPGLGREDFQVFEEGVPQEIAFFSTVDVPLDVILLIDTSSSMTGKMPTVQAAARQFVRALRAGDRGAVVTFNTTVRVVQAFTADRRQLDEAIASTQPAGGTALYTGLYVALDHFGKLARQEGEVRKSAIVVLSDGEDTGSLIGEDDLLERARRAGVPIYPISLTESDPSALALSSRGRRSAADFTLRTLARESGAQAFFPKSLADLSGVYGLVAKELATQYALGYSPHAGVADGGFRRILVRVPGHPGARPRTRAGYYAPAAPRAAR